MINASIIISQSIEKETGIGTYTHNLLQELDKLNIGTFQLISSKNKSTQKLPILQIVAPLISWKEEFWYLSLPVMVNCRHHNIRIIHNVMQMPTYFRFKDAKYIITVHDLIPIMFPKEVKLKYHLFFRIFLSRTLRYAEKIIVDSNRTKEDLIQFYKISEERIKVIYLAADSHYRMISNTESSSVVDKYNIKCPYILYVGSMEKRKNIPTLIDAFRKIKSCNVPHKLVIVGSKGKYYNTIYKLIAKYNLLNEVIFTGRVPDRDMPGIYNAAELFVYPSLYEGFGLPPLEAMACGCPVITSNISSLPEVVGEAGILVNPYDTDKLASAMLQVIKSDDLKKSLRMKGLKRASRFSWKKCAEETASVYKEIYYHNLHSEQ